MFSFWFDFDRTKCKVSNILPRLCSEEDLLILDQSHVHLNFISHLDPLIQYYRIKAFIITHKWRIIRIECSSLTAFNIFTLRWPSVCNYIKRESNVMVGNQLFYYFLTNRVWQKCENENAFTNVNLSIWERQNKYFLLK